MTSKAWLLPTSPFSAFTHSFSWHTGFSTPQTHLGLSLTVKPCTSSFLFPHLCHLSSSIISVGEPSLTRSSSSTVDFYGLACLFLGPYYIIAILHLVCMIIWLMSVSLTKLHPWRQEPVWFCSPFSTRGWLSVWFVRDAQKVLVGWREAAFPISEVICDLQMSHLTLLLFLILSYLNSAYWTLITPYSWNSFFLCDLSHFFLSLLFFFVSFTVFSFFLFTASL